MGVETVVDFDSKLQSYVIETPNADPMASEWMRYLASIAMTAVATTVTVGGVHSECVLGICHPGYHRWRRLRLGSHSARRYLTLWLTIFFLLSLASNGPPLQE